MTKEWCHIGKHQKIIEFLGRKVRLLKGKAKMRGVHHSFKVRVSVGGRLGEGEGVN